MTLRLACLIAVLTLALTGLGPAFGRPAPAKLAGCEVHAVALNCVGESLPRRIKRNPHALAWRDPARDVTYIDGSPGGPADWIDIRDVRVTVRKGYLFVIVDIRGAASPPRGGNYYPGIYLEATDPATRLKYVAGWDDRSGLVAGKQSFKTPLPYCADPLPGAPGHTPAATALVLTLPLSCFGHASTLGSFAVKTWLEGIEDPSFQYGYDVSASRGTVRLR